MKQRVEHDFRDVKSIYWTTLPLPPDFTKKYRDKLVIMDLKEKRNKFAVRGRGRAAHLCET